MGKRYAVERTIEAPPQQVWDLLTSAEGYPAWNPAVLSIQGPIVQGSRISLVSIVNPKRTFKLKVSVMEAPRRMVWEDGMPLGLFKGVRTFQLDARDGGTQFSMVEEYSGILSGLITKAIPDMTDSFTQFGDGLKSAAESS